MIREDKELLLQDLCARLPYVIIGRYSWKGNKPYNRELTGSLFDELKSSWDSTEDSQFSPYLRPMSSMTEEEKKEFIDAVTWEVDGKFYIDECEDISFYQEKYDWLNAHHFDYRGLIKKGLAIEITEEDNPYKD